VGSGIRRSCSCAWKAFQSTAVPWTHRFPKVVSIVERSLLLPVGREAMEKNLCRASFPTVCRPSVQSASPGPISSMKLTGLDWSSLSPQQNRTVSRSVAPSKRDLSLLFLSAMPPVTFEMSGIRGARNCFSRTISVKTSSKGSIVAE